MRLNAFSGPLRDDPEASMDGPPEDLTGQTPRLLEHERQLDDLLRCRDDMVLAAARGKGAESGLRPADRSALLGRLNDAIREKQMCLTRARRSGR